VWDTAIIQRSIKLQYNSSQQDFQKYIENSFVTKDNIELWSKCPKVVTSAKACYSEWAEESFDDALEYAYGDENGNEVEDGAHLSEKYYETRLDVVERRLAAGGVRLAATLEVMFAMDGKASQIV
jgi:hypothetical protein